jgi:hypothetical protein
MGIKRAWKKARLVDLGDETAWEAATPQGHNDQVATVGCRRREHHDLFVQLEDRRGSGLSLHIAAQPQASIQRNGQSDAPGAGAEAGSGHGVPPRRL